MALDETLQTVADEERRNILYSLNEAEAGEMGFEELYGALSEEGVVEDGPGRFETRMHHVHLPKLEDNGFATYDEDKDVVRYMADGEFDDLLNTLEMYED